MDKISSYIFVIGLLIFVFLMPMWVAIVIRLVFRKTARRRMLAVLTALPFAAWGYINAYNRGHLLPNLEWEQFGIIFRIVTTGMDIAISTLFCFGLPYLLAKAGITLGDKVMKKTVEWIEIQTDASAVN